MVFGVDEPIAAFSLLTLLLLCSRSFLLLVSFDICRSEDDLSLARAVVEVFLAPAAFSDLYASRENDLNFPTVVKGVCVLSFYCVSDVLI